MTRENERRLAKLEADRPDAALPRVILTSIRPSSEPLTDEEAAGMVAEAVASGRARDKDDVSIVRISIVDPVAYRREHGLPGYGDEPETSPPKADDSRTDMGSLLAEHAATKAALAALRAEQAEPVRTPEPARIKSSSIFSPSRVGQVMNLGRPRGL